MTSHEQELAAAVEELECANASLLVMAQEKAQAIAERDEALLQMRHRVGNMAQCTLAALRLIQNPPKGMTPKELMAQAEDAISRLSDNAEMIVTDTLGRGMAA
jgi:two-component sensor histidine kinase